MLGIIVGSGKRGASGAIRKIFFWCRPVSTGARMYYLEKFLRSFRYRRIALGRLSLR